MWPRNKAEKLWIVHSGYRTEEDHGWLHMRMWEWQRSECYIRGRLRGRLSDEWWFMYKLQTRNQEDN